MNRDIQGVIFDFNGVLLWDSPLHEDAWRKMSTELRGKPLDDLEMRHHVHGRTNRDILEYIVGRGIAAEELAAMADRKEELYRDQCLAEKENFHLAPGATELLNILKDRGIAHTIATSSGQDNLDFYFRYLPLSNWFEYEQIAYDNGRINGKPAPDLYLIAARKLQLAPEQCLVFEDSHSGIQAAHAAGIGTIIALGPQEEHQLLQNCPGVNATICDFNEFSPTSWLGR